MAPFRAGRSIRHDGVSYRPGSILVMDPEASSTAALLASQVIAALPLDPVIEGSFPSDAEVQAMTKAQALVFAKDQLGVDDLPGNAEAVKVAVLDLIARAKADLYQNPQAPLEAETPPVSTPGASTGAPATSSVGTD